MKLFQLVAALAVTALTAATSLGARVDGASFARHTASDPSARNLENVPGDVSHYSQALAYYEEALARRDEDHENNLELAETAGCNSCGDWIKQCKKTQCARPWAPECQWGCQAKLCKDGPSECRKGGACVPKYCGAQANELTSSGSSADLLARQDDEQNVTGSKQACAQCDDWTKGCKSRCEHPERPECRWRCLIALCAGRGPAECRGGTHCGTLSTCLKKVVETSGSSNAPQARDDGDDWDQEECNEYATGCADAFCHKPPYDGPNCMQACHNALCETQPICCKAA